MKITITFEDSVPWYAPFRTIDAWLEWQKAEQRRLERDQERWKEDWLSSLKFLDTGRDEE